MADNKLLLQHASLATLVLRLTSSFEQAMHAIHCLSSLRDHFTKPLNGRSGLYSN